MANNYSTEQALQIVNNPAVAYLRPYASTGAYTKSVFTNSMSFSASPETFTQAFDDTGDVYDSIATETAELSFDTALMFDANYMELIGGGLFSKTSTSAGATVVENQVIVGFIDKGLNSMELKDTEGKSFIGSVEPAITSVTASVSGVLAVDGDYTIVPDSASYSGYSIIFNSAGVATVGESETITIIYNSPEVVGETEVNFGGIKNYAPIEGYIETMNRQGKVVRISFYKAYYNANWNMAGAAENSPEASVSNFVFSIKADTSRASGSQLYSFKIIE